MPPDFVVIGAMKAGTTSLHAYLDAHPDICMSREKDTNFFAPRYNRGRSMDWYRALFDDESKLTGETSVGYAQFPNVPDVPQRIAAANQGAKIIYVLRDPIQRLVSHWVHNAAQGREQRTIDEALKNLDSNHYVNCSRYHMQIEQYLPHFPREQILIITAEDLADRRGPTLRRVFAFLGVDETFASSAFDAMLHRSAALRRPTALGRLLGVVPLLGRAARRLPLAGSPVPRPVLGDALRQALVERLANDVAQIKLFAGEQFGAWPLFV
jgi:hypothetical protein